MYIDEWYYYYKRIFMEIFLRVQKSKVYGDSHVWNLKTQLFWRALPTCVTVGGQGFKWVPISELPLLSVVLFVCSFVSLAASCISFCNSLQLTNSSKNFCSNGFDVDLAFSVLTSGIGIFDISSGSNFIEPTVSLTI